jgi:hypothetical protein
MNKRGARINVQERNFERMYKSVCEWMGGVGRGGERVGREYLNMSKPPMVGAGASLLRSIPANIGAGASADALSSIPANIPPIPPMSEQTINDNCCDSNPTCKNSNAGIEVRDGITVDTCTGCGRRGGRATGGACQHRRGET